MKVESMAVKWVGCIYLSLVDRHLRNNMEIKLGKEKLVPRKKKSKHAK